MVDRTQAHPRGRSRERIVEMKSVSSRSSQILELAAFKNEPIFPGCDDPKVRKGFPKAIAEVRQSLGKTYPLFINGKDVATEKTIPSVNPANPDEVVGYVSQAGRKEVDQAIVAADR